MKTTVITSSLLLFLVNFGTPAHSESPNIIVILADDLGAYGNKANRTPHIDRMAREGVLFTDFHTNGANCSPTRAALLTGRYQ